MTDENIAEYKNGQMEKIGPQFCRHLETFLSNTTLLRPFLIIHFAHLGHVISSKLQIK